MSNLRSYIRLLLSCEHFYGNSNVRWMLHDTLRSHILVQQTNSFWSRKKKECDKAKEPECYCCEEPNENTENALPEFCGKKKEAKCNLKQKIKCAKKEYQEKLKHMKEDYKCQTQTAKADYKNQTIQAKQDFKDENLGAQQEYCENTKPVMQCYEIPKPNPVCCCDPPKEPACNESKAECEEPKPKKVKKQAEECQEEKEDRFEEPNKSKKDRDSKSKKKKDDDCDEPKKKKKSDDCDDEPKKKKKNDDCDEPKKKKKDDECDEPKKKKKDDDCDETKKKKKDDECDEPKKKKKDDECDEPKKKKKDDECDEPKKKKKDDESDDEPMKATKKTKSKNSKKSERAKKAEMVKDNCPKARKNLSCDSMLTSSLTGMEMPVLILGTYKMREVAAAQKALKTAFTIGYRAVDSAISYGNDDILGCALPYALEEAGLERQDIFIISKLPVDSMRCEVVCETLEKSLENLKTSYVDLFMVHFPAGVIKEEEKTIPDSKIDHNCLWKCMESLVEKNKAKYIGVANFSCDQLESIMDRSKIKPSNVQVELHTLFQQKAFRKVAKELGVPVTAYAPLGISQGLMSLLKEACVEDIEDTSNILDDPLVQALAKKKGKQPGQFILRYLLQMDDQLAVTIGATSPQIITENFDVFNFCLDEGDFCILDKQDKGKDGRLFNKEIFKAIFPGVEQSPLFPWKD